MCLKEWNSIKNSHTPLDIVHNYWALKESFVKCIGWGISFPLNHVEFHIASANTHQSPSGWHLVPLQIVDNRSQQRLEEEYEYFSSFVERVDQDYVCAVTIACRKGFSENMHAVEVPQVETKTLDELTQMALEHGSKEMATPAD
jgi:phosphopantetheinyl transferase